MPVPGLRVVAAADDTQTIAPEPAADIDGANACAHHNVPSRFVPTTARTSPSVIAPSEAWRQMPALQTRAATSAPPATSSAASSTTAARSPTSHTCAEPPVSTAAVSADEPSRSTHATEKPSAASRTAIARPIPRPAPVTTAVRTGGSLRLGPVPEDNWGRWGDEDERGALNLVTPERTLAAAGACKTGKVYPLGMPIGNGTPPVFGRPAPLRVSMAGPGDGDLVRLGAAPDVGQADDLLILPSHSGTHMDALSHVVAGGTMWNGHPAGEITTRRGARRCGIERTAAFAARAVLLDVAGHSGVPLVEPG